MITGDHHFELLPTMDAADGALFGIGLGIGLDEDGFAPGSTDWAVQDSENSQNGSTAFGRDRLLGPTWSWQLHVNMDDETGALAALRSFRKAWHWTHGRQTPGMVTALRYQLDGEVRRIYGRPRRFEAPPDNKILSGYVPVSVDFKCVDGFVYSDTMQSVTLSLTSQANIGSADSGGGFVFPVTFPADLLPATQQQSQFLVEGDENAYPIIRFNGPIVNPSLSTDDWIVSLDYEIPDGQWVEIDTRPWRNTVLLNGGGLEAGLLSALNSGGAGTSLAGRLGHRQRLSKVTFKPGRFQAIYKGYSSNAATCEVRWAPTWSSY